MKPWKRIEPTEVTKVGWRTIVHKHFITNTGIKMDADLVGSVDSEAAGVIALTTDGQVVVARQFRAGPEQIMDEIPGGSVEAGEEPEAAARRELLEEVGYAPGSMEYLGFVFKDAWTNTRWHYFLATDCKVQTGGSHPDKHEDIVIDLISIKQLLHNAKHAKMTDCEAVLLAYDKLLEMQNA